MQPKKKKYRICELTELKELRSFGWDENIDDKPIQCFLVYHNDKIYSYLNHCPHTGVNLDWVKHQFLDKDKKLIQCATHGALFSIEAGLCLHGPCVGKHLQPIENRLEKGTIYLLL